MTDISITTRTTRKNRAGAKPEHGEINAADAIGSRIRKARTAAGLSQKELGKHVGLSQTHICLLENNRAKDIPSGVPEKIAETTGMSAGWILYGTGSGPAPQGNSEPEIAMPEAFGLRVRQARTAAMLSLNDLGSVIGVPAVYVRAIETNDVRLVPPSLAEKIAEATGASPEWLWSGTGTSGLRDPAAIGRRLRQARVAAGLTQAKLAELAGVSENTISRCERGDIVNLQPPLDRIARAAGVSPERLRSGTGGPEPPESDGPGTLGGRIRSTRKAAGMTQDELAGLAGTTRYDISVIELDHAKHVPPDLLDRIAGLTGVPPERPPRPIPFPDP